MPFGFLVGEVLIFETLGSDERWLRLLPLLASLASLFCFWKLTCAVMPRFVSREARLALLPLALFAGSYYLIRYAGELKPYALDVFVSCLFLWLGAICIARGPEQLGRTLIAPALLIGPATWLSYPAVFIGAALSLALLHPIATHRTPRARLAFVGFNAALLAGFASHYLLFGPGHGLAAGSAGLQEFWADAFPPAEPAALAAWLASQHTGLMFAHPNGGPNGGSTITFALFGIGAWSLVRGGVQRCRPARLQLLVLLLAPFASNLAAASLHLYPYGEHPRVALFHAPAICLLAGIGLANALARIPSTRWRHGLATALLCACALSIVGVAARDWTKPYKNARNLANRDLVRDALDAAPEGAPILLVNRLDAFDGAGQSRNLEWYVRHFGGSRVVAARSLAELDATPGGAVVAVFYSEGPWTAARDERFQRWLDEVAHRLSPRETTLHCTGEACRPALRLLVATFREADHP